MKKTMIILISLVALLVVALVAYNFLKDRYEAGKDSSGSSLSANSLQTSDSSAADTETAVEFTFYNYDGEEVKLSDYFGKPIVLNFWASWCGPCKAEMPDFQEAYEQYGGDIQFLMVNLTDGYNETEKTAKALISGRGYTFPVFFDKKLEGSKKYAVTSIPMTFFIDSRGQIVKTNLGMMDGSKLSKLLDTLE